MPPHQDVPAARTAVFGAYATDMLGTEPEAFEAALDEVDFTALDLAA